MDTKPLIHRLRRAWPIPTSGDRRRLEIYKSLFLFSVLLTGLLRQRQIGEFHDAIRYLNDTSDDGVLAALVAWLQADFYRFAGFNLAYCGLAIAALFRIQTRALLAGLFVAHFLLVRVFAGLANQSEVVVPYFLIFLLFADYRSRRRPRAGQGVDFADLRLRYLRNLLAIRGLQIQLALYYFFNGFTKAMHAEWREGGAYGDVVCMDWAMTSDLTWISEYPVLFVPLTYSALAYELLFPIWMFFSRTRGYALVFGVLLHTLIAVTMNQLVGLSLMTIAALCLFRHPGTVLGPRRRRGSFVTP